MQVDGSIRMFRCHTPQPLHRRGDGGDDGNYSVDHHTLFHLHDGGGDVHVRYHRRHRGDGDSDVHARRYHRRHRGDGDSDVHARRRHRRDGGDGSGVHARRHHRRDGGDGRLHLPSPPQSTDAPTPLSIQLR